MKAGKAQCYPEAWASPGLCDMWRLRSGLKLLSGHLLTTFLVSSGVTP